MKEKYYKWQRPDKLARQEGEQIREEWKDQGINTVRVGPERERTHRKELKTPHRVTFGNSLR